MVAGKLAAQPTFSEGLACYIYIEGLESVQFYWLHRWTNQNFHVKWTMIWYHQYTMNLQQRSGLKGVNLVIEKIRSFSSENRDMSLACARFDRLLRFWASTEWPKSSICHGVCVIQQPFVGSSSLKLLNTVPISMSYQLLRRNQRTYHHLQSNVYFQGNNVCFWGISTFESTRPEYVIRRSPKDERAINETLDCNQCKWLSAPSQGRLWEPTNQSNFVSIYI